MTEYSGPFASSDFAEANWYKVASAWAPSGILGSPASSPASGPAGFSSSGLTVSAAAADALWVHGADYEMPTKSRTVNPNAHSSWSRRDRLVARWDLSAENVDIVWIQGTPAASPVAPAPKYTDTQWDLPLFSFLVPPGSGTAITGVIDERSWLDPLGHGPIQTWDKAGLNALSESGQLRPGSHVYTAVDGREWQWTTNGWVYVTGGSAPKAQVPNTGHYTNSVAGQQSLQYWRDGDGVVHVVGTAENLLTLNLTTGISSVIFVLPAGYRPAGSLSFLTAPNGYGSPPVVQGFVDDTGNVSLTHCGVVIPAGRLFGIHLHFPASN